MKTRGHLVLLTLGAMAVAFPAAADDNGALVKVRLAVHGRFSRVAVSNPGNIECTVSRRADEEVLHFGRGVQVDGPAIGHAPGILSLRHTADDVTVDLQPGSAVRTMRLNGYVVLDVFPKPPTAPAQHPAEPASAQAPAGSVLPGLPMPLVAVVDHPALKKAEASKGDAVSVPGSRTGGAAPVPAVQASASTAPSGRGEGGPVSVAASVLPASGGQGGGLMLPFNRTVGAAAFRRGGRLLVVFDSAKPVDLAPVSGDPVFGHATYSLLASGAMLSMPIAVDQQFAVSRKSEGWFVALGRLPAPHGEIVPQASAEGVVLPVTEAGRVITVPDAAGGLDILVGTTRHDGQAMDASRHGVSCILWRTLLGVAIERLSDRLELRPVEGGFLLNDPRGLGSVGRRSTEMAAGFSRILDLADVGVPELRRRYKIALARAAAAPAGARYMPRLDAAEAALGLGLGREAGLLASITDQDSPGRVDEGRSSFIQAAASVLSGDPDATTRLANERIGNSDEAALWRALDVARREPGSAAAARVIAERLGLLHAYPEPLRQELVGEAALDIASGGDQAANALLDGLGEDPKVRLARAIRAEAELVNAKSGEAAEAREAQLRAGLAGFDRLAADPDPAVATRAAEEAVAIRLDRHLLTPGQAADRLEARTLDARMAGQELALRLRVADLRAQQRDWAAALWEMRDLLGAFPDASERIRHAAGVVLEHVAAPAPAAGPGASPVDPVTQLMLLEGNQDLLPGGPAGAKVAIDIARRLAKLDLPDRAANFLRKAMVQANAPVDRARLGLELAQLQLDQNDGAGAQAALDATEAAGLPADLDASRGLLRAQALASTGSADQALRLLASLHGADADDLRVRELAAKQDWAGEAAALSALVGSRLPATGPLDGAGQDLVLRMVGAVARSGQQDALHRLEMAWAPRFADPARRDMLRLLTAPRVTATADLSRSAADLTATRGALSALQPVRDGGRS